MVPVSAIALFPGQAAKRVDPALLKRLIIGIDAALTVYFFWIGH